MVKKQIDVFFIAAAFFLFLFAANQTFDFTNKITASVSLAVGGNSTLIENSTHDFVYEEPDNLTEPIEENLTIPEFSIPIINETIVENVSLPVKEKVPKINLNNVVDKYCEDISMFTKRCILQTEQELCHLEGKEIVCSGVINTESYSANLSTEQRFVLEDKGIPINKGKETEYFNPQEGTRFVVDWNSEKYIHIGFTSDTFYIEDFYYGTCDEGDNCSIDVGVEIKPTDSTITLPQISTLKARWDFVEDATDAVNGKWTGTVHGATHEYERYDFEATNSNYINCGNASSWNNTVNLTVAQWVNLESDHNGMSFSLTDASGDGVYLYFRLSAGNEIWFKVYNHSSSAVADWDYGAGYPTGWHLITGTFDGATLRLYWDGVEKATNTIGGGIKVLDNSRIRISSPLYFDGMIENTWLWNKTLTPQEIELLYNETRFNTSGNTETYSGTFTGGVVQVNQSKTNWEYLNWSATTPTDTSVELRYRVGNYSRIDESDSDLVSLWKLNRSDGTNAFVNSNPDNNQVLHMKFNSATDFTDYSGQGNTGTNSGSAYTQEGYYKGGRYFDGAGDYISAGGDASIIGNLNESITVSLWTKPVSVYPTNFGTLIGSEEQAGKGYFVGYRPLSNTIYWYLEGPGAHLSVCSVNNNEWNHILTTYDVNGGTNNQLIYVNGIQCANWTETGPIAFTGISQIRIGGANGNTYHSKGFIDNVRLYNTSLNATQVKELYSKEAGTYDSKGSNNGYSNDSTYRTSGIFESDGALSFDGTAGSEIYIPHNNNLNIPSDFTYSAWVKSTNKHQAGYGGIWFDQAVAARNRLLIRDNGEVLVQFYNGTANIYTTAPAGSVLANTWTHIIVMLNGSNASVWVNGVIKHSVTYTGNILASTSNRIIGHGFDADNYHFNGTIDSVAIYNRSLTSSEISDLYTSWSGWSEYDAASPLTLTGRGSVLQYEARLNTTNNSLTPVLNEVNITYEALPGSVGLLYPVNDTILNGRNIDFRCNAAINNPDINLKNITLYVWNSTDDSLVYSNTQVASGSSASQNWTYILPHSGSYEYNCEAISDTDSSNFSASNNTFTITFKSAVDNVTTDVDTELKPFDSLENLPQINNLVGRWDFVEDATDTSIFGNNGTVSGATHTFERYEFDGSDDYIGLGTAIPELSFQRSDNFTISVWAKPNTTNPNGAAFVTHFDGVNNRGWFFVILGNDGVSTALYSAGGSKDYVKWENIFSVDEWNHIVWTTNGTNSTGYNLYVDGVPQTYDSILDNDCGAINYAAADGEIGRWPAAGNIEWEGEIENVYIWNTTLSDEEIREVYYATRFNTEGNTVDYIGRYTNTIDSGNDASVWTNLTWTETEPVGTTVDLRYRLGNYTPVDTTDTDLVSYWKLNRSDGTNAFDNSNPDNNQVLHMKFNSATDFKDYALNTNNGTNSGSAYTDLGYIGGARSFDGSNDRIGITTGPDLNFSSSSEPFTVSGWIKTPDIAPAGSAQTLISNLETAAGWGGWRLRIDASNARFTIGNDAGWTDGLSTSVAGRNNEWLHLVGRYNNTGISFFVNGKIKSKTPWFADITPGNTTTYIGYDPDNGFYAKAVIDNVRVYNTSLTNSQVLELYAKEAGTYDEMNTNLGTPHNTTRTSGIFNDDLALEFDGENDYVSVANNVFTGLNELTIAAWTNLKEHNADSVLIGSWLAGGSGYQLKIWEDNPNGWAFIVNDSSGTWKNSGYAGRATLNEWEFITATYDKDGKVIIYINGVEGSSVNAAGNPINNVATPWNIGVDIPTAHFWNGSIDSVAIWNRSLTANEISDLYLNWSGWSTYQATSPIIIGNFTARALQYQALLNTSNDSVTPVLGAVRGGQDLNPPSCTVLSVFPANLEANSTGPFEAIINCTDISDINASSFLITRTVEGLLNPGIPNYWSVRPPPNDKATPCPICNQEILRADGRVDGKWYDDYGIFSDNFTYAAHDNDSIRVTITKSTNSALLNFSWYVEPSAFRSNVPLSRERMEKEPKKDYQVYMENGVLVKMWDLEAIRNTENYTSCGFRNINYTKTPSAELKAYYCNSSFNMSPRELPSGFDMTNQALLFHFNNDSTYGETDTLIYDFSGNENNGTAVGTAVPTSAGKFNGAFDVPGTNNNYIQVADSDDLDATEAITISTWIDFDSTVANEYLFIKDKAYRLLTIPGNKLRFSIHNGRWRNINSDIDAISTSGWQHIVVTANMTSEKAHIYVNALEVGNRSGWAGSGNITTNTKNLYFGCDKKNKNCLDGQIDETVIFKNRVLNASEVSDLYYNGITCPEESANCVFINSFTPTDLDNIYYSSRNSSYSKSCYGIINRTIGGVRTTNTFYVYYKSETTEAAGNYTVRYANETSGTNVSFKDSETSYTTPDCGFSWDIANFTSDIWFSGIKLSDQFQLGVFVEDKVGNNYTNFSMYTDDIGDVNFPITSPSIEAYMQGIVPGHISGEGDVNLNGSYRESMTIHVNIAIDPDENGTVNHTLYLANSDSSINYTINNSFYSTDDSDKHIYFNTKNVNDGKYKMNVTARADDNPSDIESYLTENNFTVDNTIPVAKFKVPTTNAGCHNQNFIEANATANDTNLNIIIIYLYNTTSGDTLNFTNCSTSSCFFNFTGLSDDNYTLTMEANDDAGNRNSSSRNIRLDTNIPSIDFVNPTTPNGTHNQNWISANVTANDTNIDTIMINLYNSSDLINFTNSSTSPLFINFTNLPDGDYYLNATVNDTCVNSNSTKTRNITLDTTIPIINFVTPTTANGFYQQNWIFANVTVIDLTLDTILINLYNSSNNLINFTNSSTSPSFINFTNLADGKYYINATANDSLNHKNNTETRTIYLDNVAPAVKLISPLNQSTTLSPVNFRFEMNETTTYANCTLFVDGQDIFNWTNISSANYNYTLYGLTLGSHLWNVSCVDGASLTNNTPIANFTVIAPLPAMRGGGGAGGARAMSYMDIPPLYVNEKAKITIDPKSSGQLIVSYFDKGKWEYIMALSVSNGVAYFTPTKAGMYRFDFKIFNNIAITQTATAKMGSRQENPMNFAGLFTSKLANQVKKEIKEKPAKETKEKSDSFEEKTEQYRKSSKESKAKYIIPAIPAVITLVIFSMNILRRGNSKNKKKKKRKRK